MTRNELRNISSRVCSIANRLASETGSRSAAFVQAWAIVKGGGVEMAVKGVSFGRRQEALRRLAGYDPSVVKAFLVPEAGNPADSQAVAILVMVQGGRGAYRIGYVPREQTALVRALRNNRPSIRVVTGNMNGARIRLAA